MSSSNTNNGQAPSQQTQQVQQGQQVQQNSQIQQILHVQQVMQTQQMHQIQNQQIQNQQPQQASRPQRRRRHRRCRARSKLPCPVPGCDGDACERHMMIHTLQCKVSGCPLGNPFFANVKMLGNHLVNDHNNGDHKYCHWAGCDPNVERAPNNNMVHIRLHNHRI